MSDEIQISIYFGFILAAFLLVILHRKKFDFLTVSYFKFIFTWPKFLIYLTGTLILVIPVPFIEIHSWDYPIAICQPIIAYIFAPWAVRVFIKAEEKKALKSEIFVALVLMLTTGAWAPEIYLLWRDGYYMPDWIVNIPIGIVCFLIVGFLWNVDWSDKNQTD